MCIRDRFSAFHGSRLRDVGRILGATAQIIRTIRKFRPDICLLYTSDAADERSSVDLGGRRIIKKKKNQSNSVTHIVSLQITHIVIDERRRQRQHNERT